MKLALLTLLAGSAAAFAPANSVRDLDRLMRLQCDFDPKENWSCVEYIGFTGYLINMRLSHVCLPLLCIGFFQHCP
jgi:hypothetical protein